MKGGVVGGGRGREKRGGEGKGGVDPSFSNF